MRIGFDIDGVLFPWADVANEELVARYGIADPGPHVTWDHLKQSVTPEQWRWLWTAEGQYAVFSQCDRVYPRAIEAVVGILKEPANRVHFVTHRDPRRTGILTAEFLSLHFGAHPWAGMHVLQNGTPKHELAKWDVFVDDKPETVVAMLVHTEAHVFTPRRPWNGQLALIDTERFHYYDDPAEIARWVADVR